MSHILRLEPSDHGTRTEVLWLAKDGAASPPPRTQFQMTLDPWISRGECSGEETKAQSHKLQQTGQDVQKELEASSHTFLHCDLRVLASGNGFLDCKVSPSEFI